MLHTLGEGVIRSGGDMMEQDGKVKGGNISQVLDHIQKLPSLPSLVIEILENFDNEKLDVATLAGKIACDQAIVARVMRVANSPFFGLSGQIGSIPEAISVLGFNNLRGLVTAAAMINVFPQAGKDFDWAAFWQHSIAAAVCAKVLARHTGLNPETAFTAGLLHDVGKLVMGVYFPQAFTQVNEHNEYSTAETLRAEQAAIGLDHAELGGEVARRWCFPTAIREAIELHHVSELRQGSASPGQEKTLTDAVYIANLFSHALEDGHIREEKAALLASEAWARLGIEADTLDALAVEAQRLYEGAVTLIGG